MVSRFLHVVWREGGKEGGGEEERREWRLKLVLAVMQRLDYVPSATVGAGRGGGGGGREGHVK